MTSNMLACYPEVFAGGAWRGFPMVSPLRRCHATSRVLRLTGTEVLVKQQQAARRYQKNQNKPERHDQLMRAGSPATKGDH